MWLRKNEKVADEYVPFFQQSAHFDFGDNFLGKSP